jgi:hypothetical protein
VLPWALLTVAAVVGALLAGASALVAGCLVVLACAAIGLGWYFGENSRVELEDEIEHRTSELKRALSELEIAQAETVQRLSMAVEFRDEDTGAHIERIGRFSVLLAEHIGMDSDFCERLRHAAPLHDVGKVAIPDAILLKPGPLTPEERAIVETHAEEGHRLVRGSSSSILDMAATIALSHQEKWDGSGYPRGLKGEAIPIEGRIVAVADVFDALTSDRVYRKAFSIEDAVQMMREQRGRHFDPVCSMRSWKCSGGPARTLANSCAQTLWRSWRARSRRLPPHSNAATRRWPRARSRRRSRTGSHRRRCTPRSSARRCGASTCSQKLGRSTRSASTARRPSPGACWRRSTAT